MAQTAALQLTPEEEAKIQAAIKAKEDQAREELVQAEIRNRILLAERNIPGKRYC